MHLAVSLSSKEGVCGVGDRLGPKDMGYVLGYSRIPWDTGYRVTKAAFVPNLKTLVGVVTWFK